jgi:hypothetical protein
VGLVRGDKPGRDDSQGPGRPGPSRRRATWWTTEDGSAWVVPRFDDALRHPGAARWI